MKTRHISLFFLALALLASCKLGAVQPSSGAEAVLREEIFLPRSVVVTDLEYTPIPLSVRSGKSRDWIPASLDQAVDELVLMLPGDVTKRKPTDLEEKACGTLRAGSGNQLFLCRKELCDRFPVSSRDGTCSFFSLLSGWTKDSWLGGKCSSAEWKAETVLAGWFYERNIKNCTLMSELVQVAFLMRLSGVEFDADKLTRSYADYHNETVE